MFEMLFALTEIIENFTFKCAVQAVLEELTKEEDRFSHYENTYRKQAIKEARATVHDRIFGIYLVTKGSDSEILIDILKFTFDYIYAE